MQYFCRQCHLTPFVHAPDPRLGCDHRLIAYFFRNKDVECPCMKLF